MSGNMNSGGLLVLQGYDQYANDLVLETVARLTEDEFTRESSPSHHSVRNLILHALETEQFFLSLCQERPRQALPELPSVADIRLHWAMIQREFQAWIQEAHDDDLARELPVPFRKQGQSLCMQKWQLVLQALMHCAQHRSELSVVLTELGHPLPNLDIIVYFAEGNRSKR